MARCVWCGACSHMAVRCGQCEPSCAQLGRGFMTTRHRRRTTHPTCGGLDRRAVTEDNAFGDGLPALRWHGGVAGTNKERQHHTGRKEPGNRAGSVAPTLVPVRSAPECARPRATRQHGGKLARPATLVPLRLGQTWRCLASMDSDFEAFSRNPADRSFAVSAFQLAAFSSSNRSSNRLSSAIGR